MTMTGMSILVSLKRRSISMPVISGMRTSVMMQPSVAAVLMAARNATALSWLLTSSRALRSRNDNESRAASSSSMTCTTALDGIADLLLSDASEREIENGSATRIGLGPNLPAVRLHDGPANRQAHSHSLLLRRDKRLKQPRHHVRCDSRSGIGNGDADHIIFSRR